MYSSTGLFIVENGDLRSHLSKAPAGFFISAVGGNGRGQMMGHCTPDIPNLVDITPAIAEGCAFVAIGCCADTTFALTGPFCTCQPVIAVS
jgi:hypothetical protein